MSICVIFVILFSPSLFLSAFRDFFEKQNHRAREHAQNKREVNLNFFFEFYLKFISEGHSIKDNGEKFRYFTPQYR